jgi:cytochrome c-type biogenesis protein CcmH
MKGRSLTGLILIPFTPSLLKGKRGHFPRPARDRSHPLRINSLLFLTFFFLCAVAALAVPTTQEIEEALSCQCGCGLTVHSCNHLQCGFAVPAKQTIVEQVSQGKGKEEITAAFVVRYGEKVLSAPTTSGFNLAAWVTPFLAILVGGVLIGLVSLRWTRHRAQHEQEKPSPLLGTDQYRDRLKKELETFDG